VSVGTQSINQSIDHLVWFYYGEVKNCANSVQSYILTYRRKKDNGKKLKQVHATLTGVEKNIIITIITIVIIIIITHTDDSRGSKAFSGVSVCVSVCLFVPLR